MCPPLVLGEDFAQQPTWQVVSRPRPEKGPLVVLVTYLRGDETAGTGQRLAVWLDPEFGRPVQR
jgi:hypothetical protein